jgi:hypothetical protein
MDIPLVKKMNRSNLQYQLCVRNQILEKKEEEAKQLTPTPLQPQAVDGGKDTVRIMLTLNVGSKEAKQLTPTPLQPQAVDGDKDTVKMMLTLNVGSKKALSHHHHGRSSRYENINPEIPTICSDSFDLSGEV